MSKLMYNVQCLSGHVWSVTADSKLGERCRKRGENGYLDALMVHDSECSECEEDRRRQVRLNADMLFDEDFYDDDPKPKTFDEEWQEKNASKNGGTK